MVSVAHKIITILRSNINDTFHSITITTVDDTIANIQQFGQYITEHQTHNIYAPSKTCLLPKTPTVIREHYHNFFPPGYPLPADITRAYETLRDMTRKLLNTITHKKHPLTQSCFEKVIKTYGYENVYYTLYGYTR